MSTNYSVHPQGICETDQVGEGTTIWAFTHVLPQAKIGKHCNLNDHVFVENDVVLGDRVTVKCGVYLWDNTRIEDDVFIGPNATFCNDPMPRSKQHLKTHPRIFIKKGASVGAAAVLLPGITIGENAMIGAGAIVTRDIPPGAIVKGNPARITGYVDASPSESEELRAKSSKHEVIELGTGGCQLWPLPCFSDLRGDLMVTEFKKNLPFQPKRQFFVYNVPKGEVRGEHAHKECAQFLIAIHGELSVVIDDSKTKKEIRLFSPDQGLYLPAGVWGIQYHFTSDAVLAVFASEEYENEDYLRNYQDYITWLQEDL